MAIYKIPSMLSFEIKWTLPSTQLNLQPPSTIDIYYKYPMNTGYKYDEKHPKNIIRFNVTPTESTSKINLIIYYKTKKKLS